jgi:hypothetical protein
MNITAIEIKNIKGIEHKSFAVEILPNKPNLLVAPNGFGKSSIATAFSSMNSRRLTLEKEECHQEDEAKAPELAITVNQKRLVADCQKNEIRECFDVTVIRSGLTPKAKKVKIGAFTQATATMEVQSIPLLKIPTKAAFAYKASGSRAGFGSSGTVLPDIAELLENPLLHDAISGVDLASLTGKRVQGKMSDVVKRVNEQCGTIDQIHEWIKCNVMDELRSIAPLNNLASDLQKLGLASSELEAFLAAYQICEIWKADKKAFDAARKWLEYTDAKNNYQRLLLDICSSDWKWAKLTEDKKEKLLSVVFPSAHQLSNGQRDLVTLVVQMHLAIYEGSKNPLILVIDEVFDYLDDANLVAFQYFVTKLIDAYKRRSKLIYPIILTHLDPGVFFDFCFNKHKIRIHYLQTTTSPKSNNLLKLIQARDEDANIKDLLEKHWFHFHPDIVAVSEAEWPNSLPNEWRESVKFHAYTTAEVGRYLSNKNFDPLAICFALRVKIEGKAHSSLTEQNLQVEFLEQVRTTNRKMDFVVERGKEVPEIHFLLGLIYNTNLHWKPGRDYISPLVARLNHPTIRRMISQVFN